MRQDSGTGGRERRKKSKEEERKEEMAKKQVAAVKDPSEQKGQKSGNPGKARLHEGEAGSGKISGSKFSKDERDSVSEKEPGKSCGPNG